MARFSLAIESACTETTTPTNSTASFEKNMVSQSSQKELKSGGDRDSMQSMAGQTHLYLLWLRNNYCGLREDMRLSRNTKTDEVKI
jgi:hypothetical protein